MRRPQTIIVTVVFYLFACSPASGNNIATSQPSNPPTLPSMGTNTSLPATGTPLQKTEILPDKFPAPPPLLPDDEVQKLLLDLLENNGGCELPCWWGITPGKSNWHEARRFFEKFSILIHEEKDVKVLRNGSEVELNYHGIEYKLSSSYENSYINFWTQNDLVDSITVKKIEGSTGFFIPSDVVKQFGIPSRIWMNARETPDEKWMVAYNFVYDEQKFVIRYFSFDGQEEDGMILACFQEASGLDLFSQNEILSRDTLYQNQLIKIVELDLAEFSESRLQEFISNVEASEEEFCVQTSLQFWE